MSIALAKRWTEALKPSGWTIGRILMVFFYSGGTAKAQDTTAVIILDGTMGGRFGLKGATQFFQTRIQFAIPR